jgi:hypothetical protein
MSEFVSNKFTLQENVKKLQKAGFLTSVIEKSLSEIRSESKRNSGFLFFQAGLLAGKSSITAFYLYGGMCNVVMVKKFFV